MVTNEPLVREIAASEFGAAADLISRAMAENPIHLAVWPNADARADGLRAGVELNLAAGRRFALGAWSDARLVGVAVLAPAGMCRPSPEAFARSRDQLDRLAPGAGERWAAWRQGWGRHDPSRQHVHLGPFAVEADYRRQGLGSLLMRHFCTHLDEVGTLGHLEADKRENVPFYERFGFRAVTEEPVLGVPTWFMSREPSPRRAEAG